MFPLVERFLGGAQSLKAFCLEHGLSERGFYYWCKKYAASVSRASGALVEVSSPEVHERALMEVEFPGGARLRGYMPVSADFLGSALQRERSQSC